MTSRLPWVWDYDIDESQFRALLAGEHTVGRLDQRLAVERVPLDVDRAERRAVVLGCEISALLRMSTRPRRSG